MKLYNCALLCAILTLSILEPSTARKTFGSSGSRHTYPKSSGHSGFGGGSHTYPQSHSYPHSPGISGNNHGSPGGGSHGYPPSNGKSGYGNTGNHGYPPSNGQSGHGGSGNHAYPPSNGISGNRGSTSNTNVHYHYHYNPPKQISYAPVRGAPAQSYPVYHGTPPTYVYQYKDSGSKYGTLLAGLALLNLGTLGVATYAATRNNGGGGGGHNYTPQPGEVCKFGVKKENGDYEETRIDCQLITSFILQDQASTQNSVQNQTTITTSTTVTNITNNANPTDPAAQNQTVSKVLYEMLPNGTLVPTNMTVNATANTASDASQSASSITTTTTNTTIVNAIDVKGKPVDVTPGMQCYVIRNSPVTNMRKAVPCGLLQTYAESSLKRNSASRSVPTLAIMIAVVAAFVIN